MMERLDRISPPRILDYLGYALVAAAALLAGAHLLWSEGDSHRLIALFNLQERLTVGSWLMAVQLGVIALLGLAAFVKELRGRGAAGKQGWIWLLGSLVAVAVGIFEILRGLPERLDLDLPNLSRPDAYGRMLLLTLSIMIVAFFGWFVVARLWAVGSAMFFGIAGFSGLMMYHGLSVMYMERSLLLDSVMPFAIALAWFGRLAGCTLLILGLLRYLWSGPLDAVSAAGLQERPFPAGARRRWIFLGIGTMTFTIIFVQILLFRMLNIFGDYMTANSVISIALLGITVGGLIGAWNAARAPVSTMIGAGLLLPVSIILAFSATVQLTDDFPFLASLLLTLPFICTSTVITVVLARARSHLVYCIDLVGAALGALMVGSALNHFREEGSVLMLAAFTFVAALCFIWSCPHRGLRVFLALISLGGAVALVFCGMLNLERDLLNIVRTKVSRSYPNLTMRYSRSSFVGRYDVIQRKPSHMSYATFDNGRIIDNIRQWPEQYYKIDPRVPHTLMDDASILILGLSGDGISKTAKSLCKEVYGVEINPVVVDLQSNELASFNRHSYQGIQVSAMDGRSYVEQATRDFDIITMMNAHSMRGRTSGRAASPEYLHTVEAMESYLEKLSDRGFVNIEEAVSYIRREVPVWKLMVTMRQALLNHGAARPERHFFVFQWKTRNNNYIQILMKKTPWTPDELRKLRQWVDEVDRREDIEDEVGRRLGPIHCKTTLLFTPDETRDSNYDLILRGRAEQEFLQARLLRPTTDDRPFHFDVEPDRPEFKDAYSRTLLMVLVLSPFLLSFLWHYRDELRIALPYVLVVMLTGFGYLLVEVVFIQRLAIFLGSPVVTFCTVLGTMLLMSGLGSLWSGQVGQRGLYGSLVAVVLLLAAHEWWIPKLFGLGVSWPVLAKVALAAGCIAPLAFFMGVPFPYALRTGKQRFSDSAAAVLFAINAAASALAVPLSINISASYGFGAVFETGMVLYALVGLVLIGLYRPGLRLVSGVLSVAAIVLLAVVPWLINHRVPVDPDKYWQVYSASCGRGSLPEEIVFEDGRRARRERAEYLFHILRRPGRTVLVDTGPGSADTQRGGRLRRYVSSKNHLETLGLAPENVNDVIISNAQADHIGDLALYPAATIWIQRSEYEHATSRVGPEHPRADGFRWRDVEVLVQAQQSDRLRLLDGEQEIFPGVTVFPAAGSTPGTQCVSAESLDGPIIMASEVVYLSENSNWHRPIGTAVDPEANLQSIRALHHRAASPFMILPGYEPNVIRRFPNVARGLAHITAVE